MPSTSEYAAMRPAVNSARRGSSQLPAIHGTMRNPPAWIAQNSMSAARQSVVPWVASHSAGSAATPMNAAASPTSGAAAAMRRTTTRGVSGSRVPLVRRTSRFSVR